MLHRTEKLSIILALAALGGCASTSTAPQTPGPAAAATAPAAATTPPAHSHHGGIHGGPMHSGMHGGPMHGGSGSAGMSGDMCPMRVEGTQVTASDVEGGIALTFTTATGDVSELRQRVQRMAEMHGQSGHMPMGPGGAAAGPGQGHHGTRMGHGMRMPEATTSIEEVPGGSRLVLRPKDPAMLGALREHARQHSEHMQGGACPMMAEHAAPAPAAPPAPGK